MIRWRLGNTTFTVEFSFFAVAAVAALWGGGRYVLLLFLAGLFHELGHLAAMGLFHRSVRSVALCGAGTLFTPAEQYGAYWQDIVVSLSGPAVNLVLGGIFLSLDRTSAFGMLHLGLGLFNLLPYANLDGRCSLRQYPVDLRRTAGSEKACPESCECRDLPAFGCGLLVYCCVELVTAAGHRLSAADAVLDGKIKRMKSVCAAFVGTDAFSFP